MRGQLAQRQVGGRQQKPLEAEAQEVVCGAGAREAQEEHPTAAGQEADARDAREGAVHRAAVAAELQHVAAHAAHAAVHAARLVRVPVLAAAQARAVVGVAAVAGLEVEAGVEHGLGAPAARVGARHQVVLVGAGLRGGVGRLPLARGLFGATGRRRWRARRQRRAPGPRGPRVEQAPQLAAQAVGRGLERLAGWGPRVDDQVSDELVQLFEAALAARGGAVGGGGLRLAGAAPRHLPAPGGRALGGAQIVVGDGDLRCDVPVSAWALPNTALLGQGRLGQGQRRVASGRGGQVHDDGRAPAFGGRAPRLPRLVAQQVLVATAPAQGVFAAWPRCQDVVPGARVVATVGR